MILQQDFHFQEIVFEKIQFLKKINFKVELKSLNSQNFEFFFLKTLHVTIHCVLKRS